MFSIYSFPRARRWGEENEEPYRGGGNWRERDDMAWLHCGVQIGKLRRCEERSCFVIEAREWLERAAALRWNNSDKGFSRTRILFGDEDVLIDAEAFTLIHTPVIQFSRQFVNFTKFISLRNVQYILRECGSEEIYIFRRNNIWYIRDYIIKAYIKC